MSLHDVDKTSPDRANPQTNSKDQIIDGANKAHRTISANYTTDASDTSRAARVQNAFLTLVDVNTYTFNIPFSHSAGTIYVASVPHGFTFTPKIEGDVSPPLSKGDPPHIVPWQEYSWDAVNSVYRVTWAAYMDIDSTNINFYIVAGTNSAYEGNWVFKYYLYARNVIS